MRGRFLLVLLVMVSVAFASTPPSTSAQDEGERTLGLVAGWNLIGWLGPETPIDDVVAGLPPQVDSLFAFDTEAALFESFRQGAPVFLNSLESAPANRGLWVHTTGAADWAVPVINEARSVTLDAGLNLVVWTGADGVVIEDAVATLGDTFQATFAFDGATQQFTSFIPGQLALLNTLSVLANGEGVWMSVDRDVNWSQLLPGPDAVATTATAEGAAVQHPGGFDLSVPAGALPDGAAITVFEADPPALGGAFEAVGPAWEVAASAQLTQPATVSLPLPDDLEPEFAGVARLNGHGVVEFIPADAVGGMLEVEVDGFSRYFAARGGQGARPMIVGPAQIVISGEPDQPDFVSIPVTYQVTAVDGSSADSIEYTWQADGAVAIQGSATGRTVQVIGLRPGTGTLVVDASIRNQEGFGGGFVTEFGVDVVRPSAEQMTVTLSGQTLLEGNQPAIVGGVIDGGTGPFSVSVDWGDPFGESFDDIEFTGNEFQLPPHVYTEIGVYVARVTVTDSAGVRTSADVLIDVATSVVRARLEVPADVDRGARVSVAVVFSGAQDTFDVTLDFGDGDSVAREVRVFSEMGALQSTSASEFHIWREPGTFVVTATVAADNGARVTVKEQIVVWPGGLRRDAFVGDWNSANLFGGVCKENDNPPNKWAVSLFVGTTGEFRGGVDFHNCPGGGAASYRFLEPDITESQTTREGLRFEENGPNSWAVIIPANRATARGPLGGTAPTQQDFRIVQNEAPSPNFAPTPNLPSS